MLRQEELFESTKLKLVEQKEQHRSLVATLDRLTEENQSLRSEIDSLTSQYRDTVAQLTRKCESNSSELERVNNLVDSLSIQNNTLSDELQNANNLVDSLSLDKRNLGHQHQLSQANLQHVQDILEEYFFSLDSAESVVIEQSRLIYRSQALMSRVFALSAKHGNHGLNGGALFPYEVEGVSSQNASIIKSYVTTMQRAASLLIRAILA